MEDEDDEAHVTISPGLLRPKFSTVAYRANQFHPRLFHLAVAQTTEVPSCLAAQSIKYPLFRDQERATGTVDTSKVYTGQGVASVVVHYDPDLKLLFIHSSDKSSLHENLAKAIGGQDVSLVHGDIVFRTLAGINRLQFQNIGVTKHARRNLRYAMYTGADVKQALDISQTAGATEVKPSRHRI